MTFRWGGSQWTCARRSWIPKFIFTSVTLFWARVGNVVPATLTIEQRQFFRAMLCPYIVGAVVQLVEYRTHNQEVAGSTHTRSTASNLEQVANLRCAQANSVSYPQRDGKWVVATATGWRPNVADWGDGVSASCTVDPIVRPWIQLSVSAGNGWPHNALRYHWLMPISCHFRDVKRCWSRVWLM